MYILHNSDSSAEEGTNEEDSSAPENSEAEIGSDHEENEKAVTFTDGEVKTKKEVEHKTVTLQVIILKLLVYQQSSYKQKR